MNGVIGMAQLLLRSELNAQQRKYVQTMRSSASSLLVIINDILDLSKIEAGRFDLSHYAFDLHENVDETLALLLPKAQEKSLDLTCRLSSGVPTIVIGDATRFRQVVTNLVSNAIKFTEAGRVQVRLSAVSRDRTHVLLRCEVEDTGIGIPPSSQHQLFEPFSQLDSLPRRRHSGTGLGLAICREIVGLMGRRIGFESEMGAGSTFWFELPMEVPSAEAAGRKASAGAPQAERQGK